MPRFHNYAVVASALLLLSMVPASAVAQQRTDRPAISSSSRPDALLAKSDSQSSAQQTHFAEGSASVAGTVLDVSGASISGADVSLMHEDGTYSYLLGDLSAAALSNLYYPKANRGAGLVFTNTAVGLAGGVGLNIVREFLSKHVTTNLPGGGK
jgi:hypothetical protein